MQLESMGDFCVIPLTQGMATIVDPEDYEKVAKHSWAAHWHPVLGAFKATGAIKQEDGKYKYQILHRFILDAPAGMDVDHINHDTLDNRKCNLRVCTHSENLMNQKRSKANTSGYKGVHWHKKSKRWVAQVRKEGKTVYCKLFVSKEDAARAYDAAALEHHGEFASINFGGK